MAAKALLIVLIFIEKRSNKISWYNGKKVLQ